MANIVRQPRGEAVVLGFRLVLSVAAGLALASASSAAVLIGGKHLASVREVAEEETP